MAKRRIVDMHYAIPLCVAASVAAHLLLLTVQIPPEPPRQKARKTQQTETGAPRSMQVRVIPQASAAAFKQLPAATKAVPFGPAAVSQLPEFAAPARREIQTPVNVAKETAVETTPTSAETSRPVASFVAGNSDQDDYIPRSLLSVAPIAQTMVLLVAPAGDNELVKRTGILSLFIDEVGRVKYVLANEPLLPTAFEETARAAFMATLFAPGQKDGLAVKSKVRVEVVFDNTR